MVLELPSRSKGSNDNNENTRPDIVDNNTEIPVKLLNKKNKGSVENELTINTLNNVNNVPPTVKRRGPNEIVNTRLFSSNNNIPPHVRRSDHEKCQKEITAEIKSDIGPSLSRTKNININKEQIKQSMDKTKVLKAKIKKNIEYTYLPNAFTHLTLSPLVHLDDISQISSDSFLAALKDETSITDPEIFHKNCYEELSVLKASHILDKYILSDDEAAVLCAIPMLLDESFSFQELIKSCEYKEPSNLMVLMLIALRKLPRYKGEMYLENDKEKGSKRKENDSFQFSFCVAAKHTNIKNKVKDIEKYREVFKIEEGWGYDISDFALRRKEKGCYDIKEKRDIIFIEPWRMFRVINSGINRPQIKMSIVPIKMVENELIYEKEIAPNISLHAARILREGMDDEELAKKMLNIISSYEFDVESDNKMNFRDNGGIECLIDCYDKHNTLAKEVISSIANTIEEDKICAFTLFEREFIKTISYITFENIDDREFCLKSISILRAALMSLETTPQYKNYFTQIEKFELICELMLNHPSDEEICLNILVILIKFLNVSEHMDYTKENLKPLFESGIFDVIVSQVKKSKNDSLINSCIIVINEIYFEGLHEIVEPDANEGFSKHITFFLKLICNKTKPYEVFQDLYEDNGPEFINNIYQKRSNSKRVDDDKFIIAKEIIDIFRVAGPRGDNLFLQIIEGFNNNGSNNSEESENNKSSAVELKIIEEENITEGDIKTALNEIGISDSEKLTEECANYIEGILDYLDKKYIHTKEEATLITTYTYGKDDIVNEKYPYRIINQMLWADDDSKTKDQMNNKKSYLRLLLRALRKLPRTNPQTLYRGIKNDKHNYSIGEELLWKGFSSTSTSMNGTQDFLTDGEAEKAGSTLFDIRGMWGYEVSDFSFYPKENEILFEPMLKFRVKEVIKEEQFTMVVVEPIEQPLILSDEIPPGCIQHVISNLVTNKDSKETCDRVCEILCNVDMDDDASPDNTIRFSEYGGVEVIRDLFEKYQSLNIAKAFAHAIDIRNQSCTDKYVEKTENIIGDIFSEEFLDEQTTEGFLDVLIDLHNKVPRSIRLTLSCGLVRVANRFIKNKRLCKKSIGIIYSHSDSDYENKYYEIGLVSTTTRIVKTHLNDGEICEIGCKIFKETMTDDNSI